MKYFRTLFVLTILLALPVSMNAQDSRIQYDLEYKELYRQCKELQERTHAAIGIIAKCQNKYKRHNDEERQYCIDYSRQIVASLTLSNECDKQKHRADSLEQEVFEYKLSQYATRDFLGKLYDDSITALNERLVACEALLYRLSDPIIDLDSGWIVIPYTTIKSETWFRDKDSTNWKPVVPEVE